MYNELRKLGGVLFVERKRICFLIGVLALSLSVLGACDVREIEDRFAKKVASVTIPFEWFRREPQVVEKKEIPPVVGINLHEEPVDTEGLERAAEVMSKIGEKLSDHEDYLGIAEGEQTLFQVVGSELLDMNYDLDADGVSETVYDFAQTEHQWIDSITLIRYGVKVDQEGNRKVYAFVDVNGVNDTMEFHIQPLKVELGEKGLPVSAIRLGEPFDQPNTRTPLSKNSFLHDSTHKEFAFQWKRMHPYFANLELFERIVSGEVDENHKEIKKLTKALGIDELSQPAVFSLVNHGRGTFGSWGITGYLYEDVDLNSRTLYELTVADETGMHPFTIHYNRGTKKITHITKGSPFKEE